MVYKPPRKCRVCGKVIPFIPIPRQSWEPPVFGPAQGHYDYAGHECSEEAKKAFSERMEKEHPELSATAKELARKIAAGDM